MKKSNFRDPKRVLIFNSQRRLIAICKLLGAASTITQIHSQAISLACTGKKIVCHNLYFRHLHPDVEITIEEDFDVLDVIEYDKMCKEVRYYYPANLEKLKKSKWMMKFTAEQIEKLKK